MIFLIMHIRINLIVFVHISLLFWFFLQQSQISSKLFQIKHSPQELEDVLKDVGKVCTMYVLCKSQSYGIWSFFSSSRSLHSALWHHISAKTSCNLTLLLTHHMCNVFLTSFVFQTYAKDLCQTIRIMLRRNFQQRPTMK